jgi:hypothetical protein
MVIGRSKMKTNMLLALVLASVTGLASPARADIAVIIGQVVEVFADPSDVVVKLDTKGTCSDSVFFHIQRSQENFKEVVAVMLTAFSTTKKLALYVDHCANDRNILSHASVMSP